MNALCVLSSFLINWSRKPLAGNASNFILQIPELISRHVWAISRNFNQFRGPPQLEEEGEEEEEEEEKEKEEEEEEDEKKHVVTLQMDLHKKT